MSLSAKIRKNMERNASKDFVNQKKLRNFAPQIVKTRIFDKIMSKRLATQ